MLEEPVRMTRREQLGDRSGQRTGYGLVARASRGQMQTIAYREADLACDVDDPVGVDESIFLNPLCSSRCHHVYLLTRRVQGYDDTAWSF